MKAGEGAADAVVAAFRNVGVDFNTTIRAGAEHIVSLDPTATTDEVLNEVTNKVFAQVIFNILSVSLPRRAHAFTADCRPDVRPDG